MPEYAPVSRFACKPKSIVGTIVPRHYRFASEPADVTVSGPRRPKKTAARLKGAGPPLVDQTIAHLPLTEGEAFN
jgi:hypothetical protein